MPARALLVLVAVAALTIQPFTSETAVAASVKKRFMPPGSTVSVHAEIPPAVHPSGRFFFVVVRNRLLCTVDAVTARYTGSFDLGFDIATALAAYPVSPITLSEDGSVLAIPVGGAARFFAVSRDGELTPRSEFAAPTGSGMPAWLSPDGSMAVFASGPSGNVATIRTSTGAELDSIPLSVSETPLHTSYSSLSETVSVVTNRNILLFRHDDRGKLKQTGAFRRDTSPGDPFHAVEVFGRRGRALWTVQDTGVAFVGLNVRNAKETARAASSSRELFAPPLAASPDGYSIVVPSVDSASGEPVALNFFRTKGRELAKETPDRMNLPGGLGRLGRLVFDPTGAYLAATFPESNTIALIDRTGRELLDTTQVIGGIGGVAFAPDGRALLVAGVPASGGTSAAVTIVPVARGAFSDQSAVTFDELPGALFTPGDRAYTFANKAYAVASSSAAGLLYSFHVETLATIDVLDLGGSNGLVAVSPDAHTLVVSAGGGVAVVYLEDTGRFRRVGNATPNVAVNALAPSVTFHPSDPYAYVAAANAIWKLDLGTGAADRFEFGDPEDTLSNPVVDAPGNRLYAIEGGKRLLRLAVDQAGDLSRVNAYVLDATLDPAAPRVAFDSTASYLWCADGDVVRMYDTLFGVEVGASQAVEGLGRDVVTVGPGLVAALPDGPGPVAFFDVTGGALALVGSVQLDAAPFAPIAGGSPAIDVAARTLYLPLVGSRKVVAVPAPGGPVVTLDEDAAAAHVSFVASVRRLAYPDLSGFPGSVVVLTEQ